MRKAVVVLSVFLFASMALAQCNLIKSGNIVDAVGNPVTVGFDKFGYNYQAHMFNGSYDGADRSLDGTYYGQTGDFVNDKLVMKWSDEWLSNKDCNPVGAPDGQLDRGLDPKSGIATGESRGWCTNEVEGDYLGSDNDYHHYTYHAKFVYDGGEACGQEGNKSCIWGSFAIVEETQNDPFGEYGGKIRNRLMNPAGLGYYTK